MTTNPEHTTHAPGTQEFLAMLESNDTNSQMQRSGYSLALDPNQYRTGEEAMYFAHAVGDVLNRTYPDGAGGTRYPLKEADHDIASAKIAEGSLDVFAAADENGIPIAVTCSVFKPNATGQITHVELGRTGEVPGAAADFSTRGLMVERLRHLYSDPANWKRFGSTIEFVESDTRAARTWNDDFQGGRGVQSVFFGGSRYGQDLGFGVANVGWRFNLERTEPFTHVIRPTDVARFAIAASSQQMQVPNQATAQRIQTLISELEPSAVPHLSIAENSSNEQAMSTSDIAVTLEYDHEAYYAPNVCAKIHIVNTDVAAQIEESSVRIVSLHDALKIVGKGRAPYVEVTLDTNKSPEVDSHETIAIMNTLRHLGFTCTGWTPSPYAGIERPVLVFGGLTSAANEPVQPEYPVRYYEFGKAGTRRVALEIFSELYQKQVVLQ